MPSLPDAGTPDALALSAKAAARQDMTGESRHDTHLADPDRRHALTQWLLFMGDTTLVLGHRLSEWCGHAPALEEDIALANVALDLVGHCRLWLELAGETEGAGRSADDLAFLRDAIHYRNLLIVERPNGDMAHTTMRQFLFDAWHLSLLERLQGSSSERIAEIAARAAREVRYHLARSADLTIRLGDGTPESRRRMQAALDALWPLTGEMFVDTPADETMAAAGLAPLPSTLRPGWDAQVNAVLAEATLTRPPDTVPRAGGRQGRHSEALGHMLATMQFLQRAYPGAVW